jgi:hypothetical protein
VYTLAVIQRGLLFQSVKRHPKILINNLLMGDCWYTSSQTTAGFLVARGEVHVAFMGSYAPEGASVSWQRPPARDGTAIKSYSDRAE